ncbi:MAG: helix-turn-helix domain-containing protein [Desulfobacteraceae bacterium]|nr:helix-turn-helix domain-containing protein [Desulfobacteraceae bacterium]
MAGHQSYFHPEFPADFLQQARIEVRRRTASYQSVQRYKLVLLLHEKGHLNNEEAGRYVGLSGRQVLRWRKRWDAGDFSVEDRPGRGRKPNFSAADQVLIKATACELVSETKVPLSRQSLRDVTKRVQHALGKQIGRSTVKRILDGDALKPWQYKYWIFPRDPDFAEKAEPILELGSATQVMQTTAPHIAAKQRKKEFMKPIPVISCCIRRFTPAG